MDYKLAMIVVLLVSGILIFACNRNAISDPAYTLTEAVIVERTNDAGYKLYFTDESIWDVSKSNDPQKIDWSKPDATFEGDFIEFPGSGKSGRVYFGVTSKKKKERYLVSERLVPMKGVLNFRDIGGLPVGKDRIVKWGKIYRSGKLSGLTKTDIAYMRDLNIKTICDFRNDLEIAKDRDPVLKGIKYYHFPIADKDGSEYTRVKNEITSGRLKGVKAKEYFSYVMTHFADSTATDFKPVIDLLLNKPDKSVPLLYHCSGGKDRTGLMSMIILGALGVEKKVIKNEYLMSNFYRYQANKKHSRRVGLIGIDEETAGYAFVVQEEYFDAVFDMIETKYGGMENYLEVKFDLNEEKLQILRDRYTVVIPEIEAVDDKIIEEDIIDTNTDKSEAEEPFIE